MYSENAGWTCARLHPDLQVATVTMPLIDPSSPAPPSRIPNPPSEPEPIIHCQSHGNFLLLAPFVRFI